MTSTPPGVAIPQTPKDDAVLMEVVKWALAGHISEAGVTVEAGQAIRAAASGVLASDSNQEKNHG